MPDKILNKIFLISFKINNQFFHTFISTRSWNKKSFSFSIQKYYFWNFPSNYPTPTLSQICSTLHRFFINNVVLLLTEIFINGNRTHEKLFERNISPRRVYILFQLIFIFLSFPNFSSSFTRKNVWNVLKVFFSLSFIHKAQYCCDEMKMFFQSKFH